MQDFIKDAVTGGWESTIPKIFALDEKHIDTQYFMQAYIGYISRYQVVLDPKAWEAVGKTRGWSHNCNVCKVGPLYCSAHKYKPHESKMHIFLDHLMDGLSIEEALNKIK